MARTPGDRLTNEEKKLIEERVVQGWTDEKIGKSLSRNPETVRKYRIKHLGIKKSNRGAINTQEININKQAINRSNLTEEEKIQAWKRLFLKTARFIRLRDELIKQDLDYFIESWAKYNIQFDDLTATEENTLESLITIELRISENRVGVRQIKERELQLLAMLEGRADADLDLENEKDRFYFEASQANNMLMQEKNKEINTLLDRHEKLVRALNATREQREENNKIGADTFLTLVRNLSEMDKRETAGKYSELMKKATDNKIKEMQKPIEFLDGNMKPAMLIGQTYVDMNEKEKKND
jgi:hypothetical protein